MRLFLVAFLERLEFWSLPSFLPISVYIILALVLLQQVDAIGPDSIEKGKHHRLHPPGVLAGSQLEINDDLRDYESDFLGFDRSIIGRAGQNETALANNAPGQSNIEQDDSQFWTFSNQSLFGPKSPPTPGLPSVLEQYPVVMPNSPGVLYISFTTCIQPSSKDPNPNGPPGQLELYVSTDTGNQQPSKDRNNYVVNIVEGFGWLNISAKDDVYFGVFAPTNDAFTGVYNYQLTASIDGFFASYYDEEFISFVDSDSNSALLYTKNTTNDNSSTVTFQSWMKGPPAFSLYVQNRDNPSIIGMQNSICALEQFADIRDPSSIDTGMIVSPDNGPKQQFHVRNLNASSNYYAITAIKGNSTKDGNGVVGGGGTLWNLLNSTHSVNFTTKSGMATSKLYKHKLTVSFQDNNCALLFNLTFCTSVAYAAPANPNNFTDLPGLAEKYDDYARQQYTNFSYSLQQIPCDTTSSAQYSLTRNCDDCDKAYKEWLCAVTIPRCEDFTNSASYLRPRNINAEFTNKTLTALTKTDPIFNGEYKDRWYYNQSRNPMIDTDINPGPYKELLPCSDLCYELVRSCPASLQFVCPLEGHGLNYTYGRMSNNGNITCNNPGAGINRGIPLRSTSKLALWIAICAALVVNNT